MGRTVVYHVWYWQDEYRTLRNMTELLAESAAEAQERWVTNNPDIAHLFDEVERKTLYNKAETERVIDTELATTFDRRLRELLFILKSINSRTEDGK